MSAFKSHLVRVLLLSLAVLAAAGPADAAPGWSPPLEGPEKTSHPPELPLVGIDSAGTVVTAWSRFDGTEGVRVIEARLHPAGGPLGPALRLSSPAISANGLDLAVAANGTAVAVWREGDEMMAAVRPPGGAFQPAEALPRPAGETAISAAVAVDGTGDATVLWTTDLAGTSRVRVTQIPAGGDAGPAAIVRQEPIADLREPALAVDDAGRAHALWLRSEIEPPNRTTTIERAYRPAGGALTYLGDLDSKLEAPYHPEGEAGLRAPQVAIDAQGSGVAIWFRPGSPNAIRWSAGPAGGAFAPAATLGGDVPAGGARLAMNAAGNAVIAGVPMAAPRVVWVAERPAGGTFGSPATVATTDVNSVAGLAVGAGGETVVTWLAQGAANQARAAYRPAAGAEWIPTDLGPPAANWFSGTLIASAAVNDAGEAAVAWSTGTAGALHTMQARYEPPQPAPPQPPSGDTPDVDAVAPIVRDFAMTRTVFAVAGRKRAAGAAARRRGPKRGSAFRFTLSERAQVRIAVERIQRGRRHGGRCRPAARTGRRCLRYRAVGELVHGGRPAGLNRIAFSGRVARRALKPGRYRATVVAIDAAGNRSKPTRERFRIVRAR